MPSSTRHHPRTVLVALGAIAGLLLAPGGASAGCEAMTSAGTCPPSMVSCCCNKAKVEAETPVRVELTLADRLSSEVCPVAGHCSCEGRPEVPSEPASTPVRSSDEVRADRGGSFAVEIPELRPSPCVAGSDPLPTAGPPHVPLYLRNARFLI